MGYDLSPLAVLAARTKATDYEVHRLRDLWWRLYRRIDPALWNGPAKDYPDLVRKALPGELLGAFDALDRTIGNLEATRVEQEFFRLALLSTIPEYSHAVATGGWLKWAERHRSASSLLAAFSQHVVLMLEDLESARQPKGSFWRAEQADARSLPDHEPAYTAVITSPPYLNRHDYTRVFGVELMFGFLDWEETRQLRYQSFHSHPEAHPLRSKAKEYFPPTQLAQAVARIREKETDYRVIRMIEGYFLDLYLALREVHRVCRRGTRVAFVVGNAQYRGIPVAVDELTAEVGEQAGLKCEKLLVARYRGNSAQQMGKYGRKPSRESVVAFRKP
jgi:hypothetical protein